MKDRDLTGFVLPLPPHSYERRDYVRKRYLFEFIWRDNILYHRKTVFYNDLESESHFGAEEEKNNQSEEERMETKSSEVGEEEQDLWSSLEEEAWEEPQL